MKDQPSSYLAIVVYKLMICMSSLLYIYMHAHTHTLYKKSLKDTNFMSELSCYLELRLAWVKYDHEWLAYARRNWMISSLIGKCYVDQIITLSDQSVAINYCLSGWYFSKCKHMERSTLLREEKRDFVILDLTVMYVESDILCWLWWVFKGQQAPKGSRLNKIGVCAIIGGISSIWVHFRCPSPFIVFWENYILNPIV